MQWLAVAPPVAAPILSVAMPCGFTTTPRCSSSNATSSRTGAAPGASAGAARVRASRRSVAPGGTCGHGAGAQSPAVLRTRGRG
jgi:hypothetical protein